MANNLGFAHLQSLKVTSSLVHALTKQALARQAIEKQAHAFGGLNVEDKFFTPHEIYFIGNLHHINKLWIFKKTSFKAQKSLYSQNDVEACGPKPKEILSHQIP